MRSAFALICLLVLGVAGCESDLVTGYQPRRLGDSPGVRRGYYATKYSPEARAAEQERAQESKDHRPAAMPGGGGPSPY